MIKQIYFNFVGNKVTCDAHKNLTSGRRKTFRKLFCVLDNCRVTRSIYIWDLNFFATRFEPCNFVYKTATISNVCTIWEWAFYPL